MEGGVEVGGGYGGFESERLGCGPELGDFLVEDLKEAFGDAEGYVADVAESAGEGADGVGCVDCEGAFEDVEAEGAGVCEDYSRLAASFGVLDHVGEDLLLQPAEDAVFVGERGAVRPVVSRGAAVCFV